MKVCIFIYLCVYSIVVSFSCAIHAACFSLTGTVHVPFVSCHRSIVSFPCVFSVMNGVSMFLCFLLFSMCFLMCIALFWSLSVLIVFLCFIIALCVCQLMPMCFHVVVALLNLECPLWLYIYIHMYNIHTILYVLQIHAYVSFSCHYPFIIHFLFMFNSSTIHVPFFSFPFLSRPFMFLPLFQRRRYMPPSHRSSKQKLSHYFSCFFMLCWTCF